MYPALRTSSCRVVSLLHPCSDATSGRKVALNRLLRCLNSMVMPCTPTSQSRACEAGSKLTNRDTWQDRRLT